jgi:hypothetical protein
MLGSQRSPQRIAGAVSATDDRLAQIVGLLEQSCVCTGRNGGGHSRAAVVNDLGGDRPDRQQPADDASFRAYRALSGVERIGVPQGRTIRPPRVVGEHHGAVVETHDTSTGRERDEHPGHAESLTDLQDHTP